MDVPLRRTVPGCLWWPVVVITLGLVLVITRIPERRFVRRMDDNGFITRGGASFAWTEVTEVRREQAFVNDKLANEDLRITTSRGTAYLPLTRTDNPSAVMEYALRHLPPSVARGRP